MTDRADAVLDGLEALATPVSFGVGDQADHEGVLVTVTSPPRSVAGGRVVDVAWHNAGDVARTGTVNVANLRPA